MKKRAVTVVFYLLILIPVTSCFRKDELIEPHPRGNVKTDTISMTSNYLYQVYYRLGSGLVAGRVEKTATDLGFDCSETGWKIILNTSGFMKAADLGMVPFGREQDTLGAIWRFDKSDGNPDSLAFGKWYTVSGEDTLSGLRVYAVDRGMDENGSPLGFFQVIFDSLKYGIYYFRYAGLNGSNPRSYAIGKDPARNFSWFSFTTGTAIPAEPPKDSYDLLFTQYTTLLYTDLGEPYPYLVTGVLSNREKVAVALDTAESFQSISLKTVQDLNFTTALDAIGYDWKYYNFEMGNYTVRENLNYIVRGADGIFYKFRFIGFYNSNGEKGYPVIEYQPL